MDREARISELISEMTLEEKVSQLSHVSPAIPRLGFPNTTGGTSVCTGSRGRA